MRLPRDVIIRIDTEVKNGKENIVLEWQGKLVRCKDCRFAEHREQAERVYCHRERLAISCPPRDYDDFCKYGERSE